MPLWACLVDRKYRPKPWGDAERMPEDYYRARFRVGPDGHLPGNVIMNKAIQTAATLVNPATTPITGSGSMPAVSHTDLTCQTVFPQAATLGPQNIQQTTFATPDTPHPASTVTRLPPPSTLSAKSGLSDQPIVSAQP